MADAAGPTHTSGTSHYYRNPSRNFSHDERIASCKTLDEVEKEKLKDVLSLCDPSLQNKIITLFSCDVLKEDFQNICGQSLSCIDILRKVEKICARLGRGGTLEELICQLRSFVLNIQANQQIKKISEKTYENMGKVLSQIRVLFHDLETCFNISEGLTDTERQALTDCFSCWGGIELLLSRIWIPPKWGENDVTLPPPEHADILTEEDVARYRRRYGLADRHNELQTKVIRCRNVVDSTHKFCNVDSACKVFSAEFLDDGCKRKIYFHLPIVGKRTLGPYIGKIKLAAIKTAGMGKIADLNDPECLARKNFLEDWKLETYSGCNCLAFGVSFVNTTAVIIPGVYQCEGQQGSHFPEVLIWMIDYHLKAQGCINISQMQFVPDWRLIKTSDRRPYYLIAVISNRRDDTHVIRAFYHPTLERLVWMQSSGLKVITFAKMGEEIIKGLPEDPSPLVAASPYGGEGQFVGYYLVPTSGDIKFFTIAGKEATFVPNDKA